MSIHVHIYLDDIDTQLAVVFIANTINESFNKSEPLCSLTRAFATRIQKHKYMYSQPFSPRETCLKQGCGNTMPDLSDLVPFHSGQVENSYLLVLGQVQM